MRRFESQATSEKPVLPNPLTLVLNALFIRKEPRMGARQKINELHYIGIAIVSLLAGFVFTSIEMAVLFGVVLFAALTAGGGIRITPEATVHPTRRRHRRRR